MPRARPGEEPRRHRFFEARERDPEPCRRWLHHPGVDGVSIEYGEVVHPTDLRPVERVERGSVCAIAARVGATRLIDNLVLGSGSPLEQKM